MPTPTAVAREQQERTRRFIWLLGATVVLILLYPYLEDTAFGAELGGLVALGVVVIGVVAVRPHRYTFWVATALGIATAALAIWALVTRTRGNPLVEGAFVSFYAVITLSVFIEVIQVRQVGWDTIFGALAVYLLIGLTFGSLYDLVETLRPGSFQWNVDAAQAHIGFRQLLFFSFMTLTTIGYGDITPVTTQTQSFAIVEGVMGTFYVAVLVARFVGIYARR
jgi:hypothetical protein